MTNLEINKKVAELIGEHLAEELPNGSLLLGLGATLWHFDPCNNWADAGPILERNKIAIEWASEKLVFAETINGDIVITDEFPLRAAMLVFIGMNE